VRGRQRRGREETIPPLAPSQFNTPSKIVPASLMRMLRIRMTRD